MEIIFFTISNFKNKSDRPLICKRDKLIVFTKEKIKEGRFEIIDEKGKVVKTEETKEGTIRIERIPLGKYTIHQTEAPKGYFEAEDKKVEIRDSSELQIFDIYNKKKI